MKAIVAAFALLAMGQAVAASTPSGWERVASADGQVSVATPCPAAKVNEVKQDGGYGLFCESAGLRFMASVGLRSNRGNTVYSFDDLRKSANEELDGAFIHEATIQGRRAFGVSCSDLDLKTPCVWFVDLGSGPPLMMGVFSAAGPGTGDPAKRQDATKLAESFYRSLELKGS